MKNIKLNHILIVSLAVAIILNLLQCNGWGNKPKKEYWENPNFKPTVIESIHPFTPPSKPLENEVPPRIIIKWKDRPDDGSTVKCSNDSLLMVIDSLGKSISKINFKFLTQFPEANKLISGKFKLDTITLDFLETSGSIKTEIYPTNYQRFYYQYSDNKFSAQEIKQKEIPNEPNRKLNHSFYVSGGYDIIGKVPILSTDYYVRYKRLQLNVEPRITLEKNPTLGLNGKLGIRIK